MEDEAVALQMPFTGELRIGVIPTVAPYVLPPVVPALRRAYPDLRLLFREDRTDRIVERLHRMDLDLLLLALDVDLGDLRTLPLYADPFVFAAHPGHPLMSRKVIHNRDLDGQEILLLEDGHGRISESCKKRWTTRFFEGKMRSCDGQL
jgi:LysR family hydrogen peroxide-inducible transcriptional activator